MTDEKQPPQKEWTLDELNKNISNYLKRRLEEQNKPHPFQEDGFEKFNEKVAEFIVDLWDESIKISRRKLSKSPSAFDVETANDNLVKKQKRKWFTIIEIFGGAFFGAALPFLVELLKGGSLDSWSIGFMAIGLGSGPILISFGVLKE